MPPDPREADTGRGRRRGGGPLRRRSHGSAPLPRREGGCRLGLQEDGGHPPVEEGVRRAGTDRVLRRRRERRRGLYIL